SRHSLSLGSTTESCVRLSFYLSRNEPKGKIEKFYLFHFVYVKSRGCFSRRH
ncbi:hypothetical protein GIB67_018054, partial [Kingdonia uniflora]